jgi:hypothetical protein
MKGIPTFGLKRLKQAAAVGAIAVAALALGASQAFALNVQGQPTTSTQTSTLALSPASGPITTVPTYTSSACPSADQGAAAVYVIDPTTPAGATFGNINKDSPDNENHSVASTFTGTFTGSFQGEEGLGLNIGASTTFEVAVFCFASSSGTGAGVWAWDTFVTIDSTNSTYTTSETAPAGPATNVTVALTSSPTTATSGSPVTLTATVTPSNATGSIQFEDTDTSTDIGGAQTISGGTASTSYTPVNGGTSNVTNNLEAVYSPTGNFAATNPGTLALTVAPAPPNSGNIPLAVAVPASGSFTLTVNSTTWVVLTPNAGGTQATGNTTPVVVTDTRNTYPGWAVYGQATQWTGVTNPSTETPSGYPAYTGTIPADHGTQHIAADELGWAPFGNSPAVPGVSLGSPVTAGTTTNGLGDAAQVLASVHAGTGDGFTGTGGDTLGAALTLTIPAGQEAGPYASFLDITSVNALP